MISSGIRGESTLLVLYSRMLTGCARSCKPEKYIWVSHIYHSLLRQKAQNAIAMLMIPHAQFSKNWGWQYETTLSSIIPFTIFFLSLHRNSKISQSGPYLVKNCVCIDGIKKLVMCFPLESVTKVRRVLGSRMFTVFAFSSELGYYNSVGLPQNYSKENNTQQNGWAE